jgi:hypothetical protein
MEKSGVEARVKVEVEVEGKSKIYRISCTSGSTAVLQQCTVQAAAQSVCRAQRCSDLHICAGYGHELGLFTYSLQCSTPNILTLLFACKKAYKPSHHASLSTSVKTYSCTSDL